MNVALEIGVENNRADSDFQNARMLAQVEQARQQVKDLEAENTHIKQQAEELRKENKRIALDTFSLYELFTQAVSDVKGLEAEKKGLEQLSAEFANSVGTLEAMSKSLDSDCAWETRRIQYTANLIDAVIALIEERCDKRKLVKKILKLKNSANAS